MLATSPEGLASLSWKKTLIHVVGPLNGGECVGATAFVRLAKTDDALRYVRYFRFDRKHSLVLKLNFYSEGDGWSELSQYVLNSDHLSQAFRNLPSSVVAMFKATRPSTPRPSVTELGRDVIPVNQPI